MAQDNHWKNETIGVFSRAAPLYDQSGPPFFTHFGRRLAEIADVPPGGRVLDLATGRGAALFPAAERAALAIGTDMAPGMVTALHHDVGKRGTANLHVMQMDAEYLAFADATFDVVLCGFALFFLPDLDNALRHVARLLKPGGRCAVTTFANLVTEEFSWTLEMMRAALPPAPPEPPRAQPQPPPRDFNTPAGMTAIFERAGFSQITITQEDYDQVYSDENAWWEHQWTHGRRRVLEQLDAEALENLKAAICTRLHDHRTADGIHMPISVLLTVGTRQE